MNSASPIRPPLAAAATPNAVSALTAVATPTAPDRPPAPDAGAARRFAELLRQSRSERAAPAAVAAAPVAPATGEAQADSACADEQHGDEAGATSARPAAPTTAAKARPPTAKGATGKAVVEHARAPAAAGAADAATKEEASSAEATATPAPTSTEARADELALLAARATTTSNGGGAAAGAADATGTPSSSGEDSDMASSTIAGGSGQRKALRARGAAVVEAAGGRIATAEAGAPQAAATSPEPMAAVFGDALRAVDATTARLRGVAADTTALAGVGGAATRIGGEPPRVSAPPALALATPIDSPAFAATLGVQVSVLASDGVQHAELHLHPAETGPVSIHISVDGNAARVEFGADLAATRQAIERGLPELASALRDAGLTLTGGGVFEHAGSRRGGDGSPSPERGRVESGMTQPEVATARIARRVAAGGVDLYA